MITDNYVIVTITDGHDLFDVLLPSIGACDGGER
jgi:hypothetical protein